MVIYYDIIRFFFNFLLFIFILVLGFKDLVVVMIIVVYVYYNRYNLYLIFIVLWESVIIVFKVIWLYENLGFRFRFV